MKKLLLFCVGLMFSSLVSFGQNSFTLPQAPSFLGTTPAFLGSTVFSFKNEIVDRNSETAVIDEYRQILSFKSATSPLSNLPEINYSDGSNMPIVDLSKNYSSNFIVKEFSKTFLSQMPITALKSPNLFFLQQK